MKFSGQTLDAKSDAMSFSLDRLLRSRKFFREGEQEFGVVGICAEIKRKVR